MVFFIDSDIKIVILLFFFFQLRLLIQFYPKFKFSAVVMFDGEFQTKENRIDIVRKFTFH